MPLLSNQQPYASVLYLYQQIPAKISAWAGTDIHAIMTGLVAAAAAATKPRRLVRQRAVAQRCGLVVMLSPCWSSFREDICFGVIHTNCYAFPFYVLVPSSLPSPPAVLVAPGGRSGSEQRPRDAAWSGHCPSRCAAAAAATDWAATWAVTWVDWYLENKTRKYIFEHKCTNGKKYMEQKI